jgi:hypothetical protein
VTSFVVVVVVVLVFESSYVPCIPRYPNKQYNMEHSIRDDCVTGNNKFDFVSYDPSSDVESIHGMPCRGKKRKETMIRDVIDWQNEYIILYK